MADDTRPAERCKAACEGRCVWCGMDLRHSETVRFDFIAHLTRQRKWSEATFGPGARTEGVLDHIRKELDELAAKPNDLEEWIDVVILALDGAWRAGHSPEAIVAALVAKQAKNEDREWPGWWAADPDKAIEHLDEGRDGAAEERIARRLNEEDRLRFLGPRSCRIIARVLAEKFKQFRQEMDERYARREHEHEHEHERLFRKRPGGW